jgi:peptidyl-prolyl cis-trans isomerase C
MFKHFIISKTILSSALLASLSALAAPTDVAIVNGKTITQQDYDAYAKARIEQNPHQQQVPDAATLVEEMIDRELLLQSAVSDKLDQKPLFQEKLQELRENLLRAMAVQNYLDTHPIDEATLRKEYDARVAQIKVPSEYKARHILAETEDAAKAILEELKQGKAFGDLAKEKSIDTVSAKNQGDLGWVTKNQVEPEFATALEQLTKGKYTTAPVKTGFGWHIIQLDDIRQVPLPSFDSVKDRIGTSMQNQQLQQFLEALKKQAKIEMVKKTTTSAEPPAK